jgi:hypothetical protein
MAPHQSWSTFVGQQGRSALSNENPPPSPFDSRESEVDKCASYTATGHSVRRRGGTSFVLTRQPVHASRGPMSHASRFCYSILKPAVDLKPAVTSQYNGDIRLF